jgi:hypothetical protein
MCNVDSVGSHEHYSRRIYGQRIHHPSTHSISKVRPRLGTCIQNHLRKEEQSNWQRRNLKYELSTQIIKQHHPHRRGNSLLALSLSSTIGHALNFFKHMYLGTFCWTHSRGLWLKIYEKWTWTLLSAQKKSMANVSMHIILCNSWGCQEMWPKTYSQIYRNILV